MTELQAALAEAWHWPPSELDAMPVADLLMWHEQLVRIRREQDKTR